MSRILTCAATGGVLLLASCAPTTETTGPPLATWLEGEFDLRQDQCDAPVASSSALVIQDRSFDFYETDCSVIEAEAVAGGINATMACESLGETLPDSTMRFTPERDGAIHVQFSAVDHFGGRLRHYYRCPAPG